VDRRDVAAHFSEALTLQSLLFLVFFAAMANLVYSAVYLVEYPVGASRHGVAAARVWRLIGIALRNPVYKLLDRR